MFSNIDIQCVSIMEAALCSPLGIVVKTNDPYRARAAFYTARKTVGNPDFAELQIRVSPTDAQGELWLIRLNKANNL